MCIDIDYSNGECNILYKNHNIQTNKVSLHELISNFMYPNEFGYHFLYDQIPDMLIELDRLDKLLPVTDVDHMYKYGHLDNAPSKWTHDMFVTHNGKLTRSAWDYIHESIKNGYIESLVYVYENILYNNYSDDLLKKFMYETYTTAAKYGNVIIMAWLWHTCGLDITDWQFNVDIMTAAATNGHLHIIVWLHSKGILFTRRKLRLYIYRCPDEHMRKWFDTWMDSVGY